MVEESKAEDVERVLVVDAPVPARRSERADEPALSDEPDAIADPLAALAGSRAHVSSAGRAALWYCVDRRTGARQRRRLEATELDAASLRARHFTRSVCDNSSPCCAVCGAICCADTCRAVGGANRCSGACRAIGAIIEDGAAEKKRQDEDVAAHHAARLAEDDATKKKRQDENAAAHHAARLAEDDATKKKRQDENAAAHHAARLADDDATKKKRQVSARQVALHVARDATTEGKIVMVPYSKHVIPRYARLDAELQKVPHYTPVL
ncbi:hypothetical protein M885DRAFT_574728, partial [Pelagophyceae sp. CCMP2097]